MKFREIAPYIIIAVLCLYIFGYEKDPQTIYIPAKENTKVISNPQPIVLRDTILIDGISSVIIKENPINEEMLVKYTNLKDSISRLEAYKDAITEREYEGVLKDSVQTITVKTKVTGTLTEQIISYRTNPITIERKSLKSHTQVYLGAFTTIPTTPDVSRLDVGINMNIATKKTLYTIGYTAQGTLTAGIAFKIL